MKKEDGSLERAVMHSLRIDEISAVDRPAQPGARAVIAKRFVPKVDDDPEDDEMPEDEESKHKAKGGKKPKPGVKKQEPGSGQPADAAPESTEAASDQTTEATEDLGAASNHMPEATKQAPDDKSKAAEAQMAELTKKLDRATRWGELSDAEKAFAKAMPKESDREAFLAGKPEDRAAEIAKAKEADPVVYTAADGTAFRKSDDPRFAALAKRNDELAKKLADEQLEKRDMHLRKRAEDFPHLPGDADTKVEMLKAVEGIADSATRSRVLEMMKAQNAEMAKAFETLGTRAQPQAGTSEVEALAKRAATERKITYEKALLEVLGTPEGQRAALQGVR